MRWSPGEAADAAGAEQGSRLAAELGLLPAVGRALWARGLREAEEAARFLQPRLEYLPDPFALKGIDAAVARLSRALEAREAICVYGDYDVDGVTSTALLVSVLRALAPVGLAFHLLRSLRKRLSAAGWVAAKRDPTLREQLHLVALGTIADVVPLTGATRAPLQIGPPQHSRGCRASIAALKSVT